MTFAQVGFVVRAYGSIVAYSIDLGSVYICITAFFCSTVVGFLGIQIDCTGQGSSGIVAVGINDELSQFCNDRICFSVAQIAIVGFTTYGIGFAGGFGGIYGIVDPNSIKIELISTV